MNVPKIADGFSTAGMWIMAISLCELALSWGESAAAGLLEFRDKPHMIAVSDVVFQVGFGAILWLAGRIMARMSKAPQSNPPVEATKT
ncbi:MAG: hypothetical protein WA634_07580 [Silvibacterium sp.]